MLEQAAVKNAKHVIELEVQLTAAKQRIEEVTGDYQAVSCDNAALLEAIEGPVHHEDCKHLSYQGSCTCGLDQVREAGHSGSKLLEERAANRAWKEGVIEACRKGKMTNNPYPRESNLAEHWNDGFKFFATSPLVVFEDTADKERLAELEVLEKIIISIHNGYKAHARKAMPTLKKPETSKQALIELIREDSELTEAYMELIYKERLEAAEKVVDLSRELHFEVVERYEDAFEMEKIRKILVPLWEALERYDATKPAEDETEETIP